MEVWFTFVIKEHWEFKDVTDRITSLRIRLKIIDDYNEN